MLYSALKDCLQRKLPPTEIKQVFQAGTEQLHHQHIVVSLCATPLDRGNTNWGKSEVNSYIYTHQTLFNIPQVATVMISTTIFMEITIECGSREWSLLHWGK